MAQFQWIADEVVVNWSYIPTNRNDLFYQMLYNLEFLQLNPSHSYDRITLSMFSIRANAWINVQTFQTVSDVWPYINIEKIFNHRSLIWYDVRNHQGGYRGITNPCSEIVLDETYTTNLIIPD